MKTIGSQLGNRSDRYIRDISKDLQFTEDVVRERTFHLLPRSAAGTSVFHQAINSASLPLTTKSSSHNPRNRSPCYERVPSRHWISSSIIVPLPLPDIRAGAESTTLKDEKETTRLKDLQNGTVALHCLPTGKSVDVRNQNTAKAVDQMLPPVLLSQDHANETKYLSKKSLKKATDISAHRGPRLWDEFLLNELSNDTAQWLSRHRKTSLDRRERLQVYLSSRTSVEQKRDRNRRKANSENEIKATSGHSTEDRFVNRVNELAQQITKQELENKRKKTDMALRYSSKTVSSKQEEIDSLNQWNLLNVGQLGIVSDADVKFIKSKLDGIENIKKQFWFQIVEDLKSSLPYDMIDQQSLNVDDVLSCLAHREVDIRLKAIVNSASLLDQSSILLDQASTGLSRTKLLLGLECCLNDKSESIKRAAAVVLSVVEKSSKLVKKILLDSVHDPCTKDGLLAARCLVLNGCTDISVINVLIEELMNSRDLTRKHEIMAYLSETCQSSNLAISLLGEKLSSERATERLRAAETLGSFKGSLNVDIKRKLSELIWTDWNTEVRRAALDALCHTDQVTTVHDGIMDRIQSKEEKIRAEAVRIAGQLDKLPARLSVKLLELFHDENSTVREEICKISHTFINSGIELDVILNEILNIISTDSAPNVRLAGAQAVQHISATSSVVEHTLLRAVSHDREPVIRSECCQILSHLNLINNRVIRGLRDQLMVEQDDSVRRCLQTALAEHEVADNEDGEMLQQITSRIERLCEVGEVTKRLVNSQQTRLQARERLRIIIRA